MPASVSPEDTPICHKCKETPGPFLLRQDAHCRDCYDKYIRYKCVKRMENNRIQHASAVVPLLLLPLSFGVSSLTLLHLVDSQLRTQRQKARRTAYSLVVLYVDESLIDGDAPPRSALDDVRARYPDAGEYICAGLEDVYDYGDAAAEILSSQEVDVENEDGEETAEGRSSSGGKSNSERLRDLLSALPSATSRMDIASILKTRLILETARQHNCTSILWGDSTTRLAEKTLAETAKGRGFSLPWTISDGATPPYYGITFSYPLRDLFKKELVTYITDIVVPPLLPLCKAYSAHPRHSAATATSGRNITVDQLMTQYFGDMERQYPGIVGNVVRTAARLSVAVPDAEHCRICGLPGDGGGGGDGGGNLTLGALTLKGEEGTEGGDMCYGCVRSIHGATQYEWPLANR